MNQRLAVEVRKLLSLMERAEPPVDEARSQRLFDDLMAKMALQDQQRRRSRRLARTLGAVLVGAGVLQLLGG
jgi:uncharacterized membrane protein